MKQIKVSFKKLDYSYSTFSLKREIKLLFLMLLFTITVNAHKINNYNFIYIEEAGNEWNIEEKIANYFKSIGFEVITDLGNMNIADKSQLLILKYYLNETPLMPSNLYIILSDITGNTIYKSKKVKSSSLLQKTQAYNCLKKIFREIDKLNYSYTQNNIHIKDIDNPSVSLWSEDSIKNYLKTKNLNSIEGIYKNYSNGMDFYRIAILRENDIYYGIIIETNNKRWSKGAVKIIINPIENNIFDVDYYDFNGKKMNSIGHYENRLFTFATNRIDGQTETFQFLKVFPTGKSNVTSSSQSINDSEIQATGSGFIISSNVIATNYHVIEGAEKIKVILSVQGTPEEYDAKILSTDKTNDLALLTIKDKKFTPLKPAPYNIVQGTVDVGTSVFTMGYPMSNVLGKEVKITDGLISSKTGFEGDAVTYQISAPIQPGNSGGALFDKKGHLVGITNAGIPSAENIGYAIKSSYLLNLIDSAPINIELPKGDASLSKKELPDIIKLYTPYIAFIKIY